MKRLPTHPRRPNLATLVGSGLAIVAAGSLLAFSSLAEQAGLQSLSTGGLRPADPQRAGGTRAITIPAPASAPPGPRDAVDELVRRVVERDGGPPPAPVVAFDPPRERRPRKPKVRRVDHPARVAGVAGPNVPSDASDDSDGPPYGHAYGYHKRPGERPEPARRSKKAHKAKHPPGAAPVYARTTSDDGAGHSKPPKMKKAGKVAGNGKQKGRGKGSAKHGHGHGKAKGHSKRSR